MFDIITLSTNNYTIITLTSNNVTHDNNYSNNNLSYSMCACKLTVQQFHDLLLKDISF